MSSAAPAPALPPRLAALCAVAGIGPRSLAPWLPAAPAAIDRALDSAIRAERDGAPSPPLEVGKTSAECELRRVARRALAELVLLDTEIAALTKRRGDLAALLDGKRR